MLQAPAVEGLPRVDSRLRWVPHEDVFVLGANAVLELGPGGGNLMGAMRGARVVSNELYGLMWRQRGDGRKPAAPARSLLLRLAMILDPPPLSLLACALL